MKTMITVLGLSLVAVLGAAVAEAKVKPMTTDEQVKSAIDARLHELLRQMNAKHAQP